MNHINRQIDRKPIGARVVIYQRGQKRMFTADFHDRGRHCRKSLATTNKKEAMRRAVELEFELNNGSYKAETSQVRTRGKVRQAYMEMGCVQSRPDLSLPA